MGIEERPSEAEERGNGGIERGKQQRSPIKTEGIRECLSLLRSTERGGIDSGRRQKRVNQG